MSEERAEYGFSEPFTVNSVGTYPISINRDGIMNDGSGFYYNDGKEWKPVPTVMDLKREIDVLRQDVALLSDALNRAGAMIQEVAARSESNRSP